MAKPIEHPEGALTIRADLPQEYALRFQEICEVSGLTPADFLRAAVLSTMKRYEQHYNISKPTPRKPSLLEDLTHEGTPKKKRMKAQTPEGQLDPTENQTAKPEHQKINKPRRAPGNDGAPKRKGWPKGKPRGKRVKTEAPFNPFRSVINLISKFKGAPTQREKDGGR